jgi:hypothetical protein
MPELKRARDQGDDHATRATARLPGLEIELQHRWLGEQGEEIALRLRAIPSFEAFWQSMERANPFVFWVEANRLAWAPWIAALRIATLAGNPFAALPGPDRKP